MVSQERPPNARKAREKAGIVARAAMVGAARSEIRYLRRLLIFIVSMPMAFFALVPPESSLTYHPGAGSWVCRIVFGGLTVLVNFAVLLPELLPRFRPHSSRLYGAAIVAIVIGTPLSYVMRLILIDRH